MKLVLYVGATPDTFGRSMVSPSVRTPNDALSAQLRALVRNEPARVFRAGQVIFAAGDPGDGFYLVESGVVKISAVVAQDEPLTLATIGAGDFFGEMAVLDAAPRSATAKAETETRAIFLEREHFLRLLEREPHVALTIIREFSARMRALNQKYVSEILQAERLAAVGRFAGTIVHDFKNPLTVIALAAELGCGENSTPALRKKAQTRIDAQIARISNMLHELIDFTKPSGHRPKLDAMDFAAFLTPLAEQIGQDIADRRVTLVLGGPTPSVTIRIDAQRLSRLFYNLINNAVDEMPGGGTVYVRFNVTKEELVVAVEDTGRGIAPEIAKTLFQPFATHGKAHGTGLGLSICKKIVEDHGGRIWAESTPGKGATFSFTLPLG